MSEEITIKNEVEVVVVGRFYDPVSNTEKLLTARTQGDGTMRFYALQVGVDAADDERPILAESNRAMGISLYGKDSDGNVDPLRTGTNQQLQVEVITSAMLMAQLRVIAETLEKVVAQLALITDVTL